MLRFFLLATALLSGLASLALAVMMFEAPVREVEGLAGMGLLLALVIFAAAAGASLWLLPADRFPRMRMAAAALWLSPFALFSGGGWAGAAVLVGGGLGYAAWQGVVALTRRPPGTPPA